MREDWREHVNITHAIIIVAVGSLPLWWLALTGRWFTLGLVFVLAWATAELIRAWDDDRPEIPQFTDEQIERTLTGWRDAYRWTPEDGGRNE